MSVPTPGYSRAELLDAYNAFTTRLDAAVGRDTERAEAMARLRRVCAGEPAGDMPPAPPPPPYAPLVDPFRRASGGSVKGGGNTDASEANANWLLNFAVWFVGGGGVIIFIAIALMLGWL